MSKTSSNAERGVVQSSDRSDETDQSLLLHVGSDRKPTTSFVLPTPTEEKCIPKWFDWIKQGLSELEPSWAVLVGGSSTDRTPVVAQARSGIAIKPDRPSYGYAYRYAFEQVRGECVVVDAPLVGVTN